MKAPARTAEQMLEAARLGGTIEVVETCRNGDQLVRCTVPGEPGATTVKIPRHLAAAPSPDPVDVLAVMNDCRNDLDAARMGVAAKELAKARAAVAELIEAAGEMNRLAKGPAGGVSQQDKRAIVGRMDAALARVQGGAA